MSQTPEFDSPLEDPAEDLLGIAPYASSLAEQLHTVPLPFTVGIYGEWGAGKTSFVRFVEKYLGVDRPDADPVLFISFSAWPYKTTQDLWQALIHCLARKLYDVPDDVPSAPAKSPVLGFGARILQLLESEAVVIDEGEKKPDPLAGYKQLVAQLDETAGTVGSDPESSELMAALVTGAMASLGTLSPLLGGLRSLLGGDLDPRRLLQQGKKQAVSHKLDSVRQLSKALQQLFSDRGQGRRICVFIDDLDRTMPDVALDLLEAARIFLDVRCIFLVAADENLIGQGLHMRLRAFGKTLANGENQDLIQRKGQEYLEKIIQLGIRVPAPTYEDIHKFIALLFPQWMVASDIIYASIGTNPRRLKQYCNLLRYKYEVTCSHLGQQSNVHIRSHAPELDKILRLGAHSPDCLKFLQTASADRKSYKASLERVEGYLVASAKDAAGSIAAKASPYAEPEQVAAKVNGSKHLLRLFRERPLFSELDPDLVRGFAVLADVAPGAGGSLRSSDGCFQRILDLPPIMDISAERFLREDFRHLAGVERDWPGLLERIAGAAELSNEKAELKSIEALLEARRLDGGEDVREPFQGILFEARNSGAIDPENNPKIRALLGELRLSSLLADELAAFANVKQRLALPAPESLIDAAIFRNRELPALERDRILGDWIHSNLDPSLKAAAEKALQYRLDAARHLTHLRTFVKLDALGQCWPEIAERFRSDRSSLIAMEAQVLQPENLPSDLAPDLEALWATLRSDQRLADFLRLRPLYRYADATLLNRYFSLSRKTTASPTKSSVIPTLASNVAAIPHYRTVHFHLTWPKEPGSMQAPVRLVVVGPDPSDKIEADTPGNLFQLEHLSAVAARLLEGQQTPAAAETIEVTRDFGRRSNFREFGQLLFELLFDEGARIHLDRLFKEPQRYRFLWENGNSPSIELPLEMLFTPPPSQSYLALTQRFSVIRYFSEAQRPLFDPVPTAPLRILAVMPNPPDLPPLNVAGERELLEKSFPKEGPVRLQVLAGAEANTERLQDVLRAYQPHIFHFVGHGTINNPMAQAAIAMANDQTFRLLAASELSTLLRDNQIRIAVLNACDTGSAPTGDAIAGLAGALVVAGIPAVVATLRPVTDPAALLFSRELYRSFVAGFSIEAAVIEGRKALSLESWDWSAYALFSGLKDPSLLRLPAPVER